MDPDTQIGPIATRDQLEKVAGFTARARADGAEVVAGGHPAELRRHIIAAIRNGVTAEELKELAAPKRWRKRPGVPPCATPRAAGALPLPAPRGVDSGPPTIRDRGGDCR